jgi:hypothetical protein
MNTLLVCNWLHSVRQNHFHVMILFKQGFSYFQSLLIQSFSRRFQTVSMSEKSDPLHPSGRREIPFGRSTIQASSVRTTRTFRPELPLCRKPSNYSSLHPSGLPSNTSERLSVFDKLKDFFPKYKYGKTVALVQTMCVPVQTLSLIRQVVQKKCNHPDVRLHGLDAQALYMEIVCISSTVQKSYFMVRTLKALIWKLHAAKVQPSGRGSIQERISSKFRKPIVQLSVRTPSATVRTQPR